MTRASRRLMARTADLSAGARCRAVTTSVPDSNRVGSLARRASTDARDSPPGDAPSPRADVIETPPRSGRLDDPEPHLLRPRGALEGEPHPEEDEERRRDRVDREGRRGAEDRGHEEPDVDPAPQEDDGRHLREGDVASLRALPEERDERHREREDR